MNKTPLQLTDELIRDTENDLRRAEVDRDGRQEALLQAQQKVNLGHSLLAALKTLRDKINAIVPGDGSAPK